MPQCIQALRPPAPISYTNSADPTHPKKGRFPDMSRPSSSPFRAQLADHLREELGMNRNTVEAALNLLERQGRGHRSLGLRPLCEADVQKIRSTLRRESAAPPARQAPCLLRVPPLKARYGLLALFFAPLKVS